MNKVARFLLNSWSVSWNKTESGYVPTLSCLLSITEKSVFNDYTEEWENSELPSKPLKRFSHVQQSIRHLCISLLLNFLKTCKLLTLTEWWYTELTLMWATQKSIYTTLLNNEKFFWKEVCDIPSLSDDEWNPGLQIKCLTNQDVPLESIVTHLPHPEEAYEVPHSN